MAFCKNCGTQLNEQGVCPNCAPAQNTAETVTANAQAETQQVQQNFETQQNFGGQPNFNQQAPNQNYQQPNYNQQAPNQNFQQQPTGPSFFDKVKNFIFNTKDETVEMNPQDVQDSKSIAWIAYLGILFFIPIVVKPTSKYSRFHANQGLLFLIFYAAVVIVWRIISALLFLIKIPVTYGTYFTRTVYETPLAIVIITNIIFAIIGLVIVAVAALGIYNAATGKAKELPLIGKFRILKTDNMQ